MAVQFPDKALDEWLTSEIKRIGNLGIYDDDFEHGYLEAMKNTQQQLHEFWGASLKPEGE